MCTELSSCDILKYFTSSQSCFEVRHPRCVSTKSNYKVYAYIVKHNYI
jgi:hypothetical protein